MKWALWTLVIIVALIATVLLIGSFLPKQHSATRASSFHRPPDAIWSAIIDYSKFPEWRKSVTRVEALPSANGNPSWREFDKYDNSLPFGGTWTYELTPQADGSTMLRITENGEIRNIFFRFVSRFLMGYTKTMEDYLNALGQKFGEKTTVKN